MKDTPVTTYHETLKAVLPTLLLLWGSVFITINVRSAIGTLSESMSASFQITGHEIIRVSSFIAFGSIITLVLSGHISYILTHTRTLIVALSLLIVGIVIVALSPTLTMLKIGFFVVGIGSGLYPGSGIPIANAMSSQAIRGKVIAIHETGSVGAFVFVPILSSLVLQVASWRAVFILFGFFSALLLCGIIFGCKEGYFRGKPLTLSNCARLARRPIFWAIVVSFAITGASNIFVYTTMMDFLVGVRGFAPQTVTLVQALSRVSSVLIIFFSGIIMARLPALYVAFFTATVAGILTVLFGIVEGVQLFPIVFLQSFMFGGFFPAIFVTTGRYFPGGSQSLVIASMILVSQIVSIALNSLYGTFSAIGKTHFSFVIVGAAVIVSVGTVVLFRKTPPLEE